MGRNSPPPSSSPLKGEEMKEESIPLQVVVGNERRVNPVLKGEEVNYPRIKL